MDEVDGAPMEKSVSNDYSHLLAPVDKSQCMYIFSRLTKHLFNSCLSADSTYMNPGNICRHCCDLHMQNCKKSLVHTRTDITEAAAPSNSVLGRVLVKLLKFMLCVPPVNKRIIKLSNWSIPSMPSNH